MANVKRYPTFKYGGQPKLIPVQGVKAPTLKPMAERK